MSALVDLDCLARALRSIGLEARFRDLADACAACRASRHGHIGYWQSLVRSLPDIPVDSLTLDSQIRLESESATPAQRSALEAKLLELSPWRKGPFHLFGIDIDSEWRSDMKWGRIAPGLDLQDRIVLDVGCGNGYYLYRMLGAGARFAFGIDPSALYAMQFRVVNKYAGCRNAQLLPLALEELPRVTGFDTVFSMGVLYHRRSPMQHLDGLKSRLRPGGELVLETLVLESAGDDVLVPETRYAGMKNVWAVPTISRLFAWCDVAGFTGIELADCSRTTPREQRRSRWMTGWSLEQFLDPDHSGRTIEGHPAPVRATVICRNP